VAWTDTGLIFTTRTGRPVEPRNLVRSFARICDDNGIRRIRVPALRHTTASLLKKLLGGAE
jgi:integrase